jgi:L1 cell adhesion molecule like protein
LKDAKVDKKAINEIVLVGGSTRIPKIQAMLSDFFDQKELCKSINPDEAVAYGAAIQAAILTGKKDKALQLMVLLDVTPLSLGIETQGGNMSVIIPRNTTIPCHKTEPFTTTEDNQTTITIPVYEGERPQTSGNNLLGTFELSGIPPAKRGVAKIDISLDLDANGILKVTAQDKATGIQNKIIISNHKGRLSDSEIKSMIDEAERNKEADMKVRKRVEAKNELEAYAFQLQSAIDEMKNISVNEKQILTGAIGQTISWLDENDTAEIPVIQAKRKDLEDLWNPVVSRGYGKK